MLTGEAKEIQDLTSLILHRYFCDNDVDFLVSFFAPDITWIGAGEEQQAVGREATSSFFLDRRQETIPCRMSDEQYTVQSIGKGYWLVQGDSWVEADERSQMKLHIHQRITMVYERWEDSYRVVHIHNSVPFSALQEQELFPTAAASEAYHILQDLLRERNQQLDLILSQLPGGMLCCYCDQDFTVKWVSQNLCKMLNYDDPGQFAQDVDFSCKGLVVEEDYQEAVQSITDSLRKGDTYHVEYRARKRDGSTIWILDFGKQSVEDGCLVLNCFLMDITARKEQELQMKRQAEFLTQLYDTVPCGIIQFSTDSTRSIIYANRRAWEIYGYQEQEYWDTVKDPFMLVLKKDEKNLHTLVDRLSEFGGAYSYEREGQRKDGTPCWVSVNMERLVNADGVEVIQAVFNDVTETKTLQQEWEQEQILENRSLRAAICSAYQLIMNENLTQGTYDCFVEDGYIVEADERKGNFDRFFERTLHRVFPSYQDDFKRFFSREEMRKHFEKGEKELYTELMQLGADGQYHWVSLHTIRVENPYSEDILAVTLLKMLDEQRAEKARQEQLLRDALATAEAASSAKSDFLSRMSHDIRTPMNAIIGMSAIGQLKIDDKKRVRDCFAKIDSSSRYLLSLINDILDMSKIEQGKMRLANTKFDFMEFIHEVTSIIYPQAAEQKVEFDVHHIEPLERQYQGDSLRLNQILMNLLSNALKFTEEGGKVILSVQEASRANGVAMLEFCVSDTGVGMSQEFMQKLYQPFEQETPDIARNQIGSGLGLSIVYNLVQLMGGTIQVESEKGKGTAFTVTLPFGLTEDDENREQKRKSRELLKGLHVLVADDDEIVGEQTSAILSHIGAHSVWVDTGRKAVEQVKSALDQGRLFDLAMIDWKMPDMNGVETTREIRKLVGPDTTIIIISAYDWSSIESEARAAGASYFISKPLFQSAIYDTLMQLGIAPREKDRQVDRYQIQGKRVLLVEDNELNLEIAKSLLEFQGVIVETAENGELAVRMFQENGPRYYNAILMDIRMPVMDGLEATRTIRSLNRKDARNVPIIAMSANAFEEDKVQAIQSGMNSYLVKPIDVDKLFQELKNVF